MGRTWVDSAQIKPDNELQMQADYTDPMSSAGLPEALAARPVVAGSREPPAWLTRSGGQASDCARLRAFVPARHLGYIQG